MWRGTGGLGDVGGMEWEGAIVRVGALRRETMWAGGVGSVDGEG